MLTFYKETKCSARPNEMLIDELVWFNTSVFFKLARESHILLFGNENSTPGATTQQSLQWY